MTSWPPHSFSSLCGCHAEDATAQFFGHMKTLSAQYRKKLKDAARLAQLSQNEGSSGWTDRSLLLILHTQAYLWMDWFCVPQIQHETDTADRERVREEAGCLVWF